MSKDSEFPNGKKKPSKPGRPARPIRSVIQLRYRNAGKVKSYYSLTVDLSPYEAMKRLQETFQDVSRKFTRLTDDPRW